jgi:hypothetical protein
MEEQKKDIAVIAQDAVMRAARHSKFIEIVGCIAQWTQATKQITEIEDDEDLEIAQRYFIAAKIGKKQFEDLRLSQVAVLTKTTRMINDTFRPIRNQIQAIQDHFSGLVGEYTRKKVLEKAKQETEALKAKMLKVEEEPEKAGEMPGLAPVNVQIETEEGDKIRIREATDVEITNPELLLKAILSVQKRNRDFTLDLVQFDYPALRRLAKNHKKIPGCVISKKSKAQ